MPIYEYQCSECGFQKEMLQKISDDPLKICEECGQESMKKMVSAAAFRLKGGGWYETDFKSGNKKNVASPADQKSQADVGGKKAPVDAKKSDNKASSGSTTTTKKSVDKKN
jgi:putative FmdB family regulatory protein